MVTIQEPRASAFPVDWNEGLDAGATFTFDPMHFPHPLTPLSQSTLGPAFEAGYTTAAREQQLPIDLMEVRHRNHFRFERFVFAQPASDTEAREFADRAEASIKLEMGRLMTRWHDEHLPAIKQVVQRLHAYDPVTASPEEAARMLDEVDTLHCDLWTIHFRIALAMLITMQLFDEFYADLFGGTEADAQALTVGRPTESIKAGIGLSRLAIRARELGLEPLFMSATADELAAALEATAEGRQWLAQLSDYLEAYGLRQDMFELATPTWREEPSFAMSSVRNYLLRNHDAQAEHDAMARSAEQALAAAREQLAAYPEAVRGQFEALVQFGRDAAFLQEEHNFHIDQRGVSSLRLFYLKVGQRLVNMGMLDAASDVFMLDAGELRDIAAEITPQRDPDQVRALVAARREELNHAQRIAPPPFIGDPPAGGPSGASPMARAMMRFFGGPPQISETPGQIKGNAGSKGVATGIARIARTLDEARHLQPGEILVAVTTMPAWTPLFGVAAAVVTETGGALSHCAIVAREYGIPAVVGAHGATSVIMPGQRVTVDGSRGIVTLDT